MPRLYLRLMSLQSGPPRPLVLMILDGWGERHEREDNAVRMAHTPTITRLFSTYPHTLIGTSGVDVGLPPDQMGNSEVGHLNFGAGRIAIMDIAKIDKVIYEHQLGANAVIAEACDQARSTGGRLHLFGLLSDGGVHSTAAHLYALIDLAHERGVPVAVHAFLDGRDVQPGTAPGFVSALEKHLVGKGQIATVSGRFWAMDRDNRWERVERAYRAIAEARGARMPDALSGVTASYKDKKTDEFVEPFVVANYTGVDSARDVGLHFNFRADRARELTRSLAHTDFDAFVRADSRPPFRQFACLTNYDASLGLPVAFPKETFARIFPEVIADAGLRQFRCAETEKYAHVTYFFNGGREQPFAHEDRVMIPSPQEVETYDEKPEMSAVGVTAAVVDAIQKKVYDFVLVNFANPDMVGHTGILDAAVRAVEAVDRCVAAITSAALAQGGAVLITSDHGNCELMRDPTTGAPHTAHTTNPVPLIVVDDRRKDASLREGGRICDVAPTMLAMLGLPQPIEMTGTSLFEQAHRE